MKKKSGQSLVTVVSRNLQSELHMTLPYCAMCMCTGWSRHALYVPVLIDTISQSRKAQMRVGFEEVNRIIFVYVSLDLENVCFRLPN